MRLPEDVDTLEHVDTNAWPTSGKGSSSPEVTMAILDQFDTFYGPAVLALGQTVIPRPEAGTPQDQTAA